MNKSELLSKLSKETGTTIKESKKHLEAFLKIVEETLEKGEPVKLIGFGSFEVRDRKARQGRNPQNPEEVIEIPASKAPVFRPSKNLKEAVNK